MKMVFFLSLFLTFPFESHKLNGDVDDVASKMKPGIEKNIFPKRFFFFFTFLHRKSEI